MERDASIVSPVNFMPNGGLEQKLTGDSTATGSLCSSLSSEEKVKSRYLSPHMASCHDFCKYGKKHESDAEERRLNLRKFLKKKKKERLAQGEEQNQVTVAVHVERMIRTVTKAKATTKVGTEFPDHSGGPKPWTPPTVKNSGTISAEPKTCKASLGNEGQDPRDGSKVNNTEGSKLRSPTMKNSIASGEDKLNISLDSEHGQAKSQDSIDGKKVEVIKGGTELHHNTVGPKPQALPTMEISIASGKERSLRTSLVNKQDQANEGDGKKVKMIKGGTSLRSAAPNQPDAIKSEDFLPASSVDTSKQPNIGSKEKTKSSVKKPISPVAPEVVKQRMPPFVTEHQKAKQRVPLPAKRVEGAGRPAITLKTKAPLVRSLSQRKSSRSLIARRDQENKITRSPGTPIDGARELLKPSTTSISKPSRNLTAQRGQDDEVAERLAVSKAGEGEGKGKILKPARLSSSSKETEENALSVQLRKLRSMRRTSEPHDTGSNLPSRKLGSTKLNSVPRDGVPRMQPRKLRSIKQKSSTPHDSVQIVQLRKLRSIKHISKPHQDSVPSWQLRKLRSVKQTSTPHESDSSLQPTNLWNVKLTSALRNSVSIFQPRILRNMKRNSSTEENDKPGKADSPDSEPGIDGLDPNPEAEESEPAVGGESDEEIGGNGNVEVPKGLEKNRSRRRTAATARAQPEDNSSTPFKLKFRRGKVVDFRSDSIGARRLWFNLGRLAGDNLNSNGLLGRRSFGSRRRRSSNASIDSEDPDSEVHSVVLKHQGVAEKRGGQAPPLFNRVIEETASKLAETRKSKVKALVGAFETVISLQ